MKIVILFDCGSQMSYITEDLKSQLNLKTESSESIHLSIFGSEKYQKIKFESVNVNFEVGKEVIPINALTHKVIYTPLSSPISIGNFPNLQGREFAGCFENANTKRIDMLIGLDFYFDFIQGDIIRGGGKGAIDIHSKLGRILSGKADNNINNHDLTHFVSTYLIVEGIPEVTGGENLKETEIVSTIKEFWKQEACRLYDIESKQEHASVEASTIGSKLNITHNSERYEVSLPFDSFSSEYLPSNYDLSAGRLESLHKKLYSNKPFLQEYNSIIQEQLKTGIIGRVIDVQKNQVIATILSITALFVKTTIQQR